MNMKKTGAFIRNARTKLGLTQRELADRISCGEKAIISWETGSACPDIGELKKLSLVFGCGITDISSPAPLREADHGGYDESGSDPEYWACDTSAQLDYSLSDAVSPLIFGDNLEHTRGCINGGISAELLRNRKFVGKPGRYGCAHEWYPIGGEAPLGTYFAQSSHDTYTVHDDGNHMPRAHEIKTQYITNYSAEICGMGQRDIPVVKGKEYIFTAAVKSPNITEAYVTLIGSGSVVYDRKTIPVSDGGYIEKSVILTSPADDPEARIEISFTERGTLVIGALSMMPADNFHGMRTDVIEKMKEIGIRVLRWPGGNFAGEYHWKEGLLPRNRRAPFQSYLWLETQPHTNGYDFHDINTDDFIALCREIGAEPFITLNPVWNTPEESAQWIEYCNGGIDTEYGRLRAENGHPEPYNVRFWSLGNEMGYGHMEGTKSPAGYAEMVKKHADKMLVVTPGAELCSSGPYPNPDWAENSAKALAGTASLVSLHHYTSHTDASRFMIPDAFPSEYTNIVAAADCENLRCMQEMSRQLEGTDLKISYDEWNVWYAWYRPGSVCEGIFAAAYLNMMFRNADKYGVGLVCHFESVNEGAIKVFRDHAELSPVGQVFSVMQEHAGGMICALEKDLTATLKDSVVTCTLLNRSYDREKKFTISCCGEILSAKLYSSDSVVPNTVFDISDLEVTAVDGTITVIIPPHSIASVKLSKPE